MRTILSFALGVTVATYAQTAQPARPPVSEDTTPVSATLRSETMEVGMETGASSAVSKVVAKNVTIEMGEAVLKADEGQILYGAEGNLDAVELRGKVRLIAKLKVQGR